MGFWAMVFVLSVQSAFLVLVFCVLALCDYWRSK